MSSGKLETMKQKQENERAGRAKSKRNNRARARNELKGVVPILFFFVLTANSAPGLKSVFRFVLGNSKKDHMGW